jgi:hypothetical protein
LNRTASFKSFCPGAIRTSFAPSCTTTVTSLPASVVNVMVFPETDLIVPTGLAAAGACEAAVCAPCAAALETATAAPQLKQSPAISRAFPYSTLQSAIRDSSLVKLYHEPGDSTGFPPAIWHTPARFCHANIRRCQARISFHRSSGEGQRLPGNSRSGASRPLTGSIHSIDSLHSNSC